MSSSDLIQAYLGGQRHAYGVVDSWVRRWGASFRVTLGEEWEDAMQEAHLDVTRAFSSGSFRGDGALEAFVSRITRHRCIDTLRKRQRHRWVDLENADPSHVDDRSERAGERIDLMELFASMPEGCQRLWRYIALGWSYREMSAELGSSEGALRVRVRRCRQQAQSRREASLRKEAQET